ncbi:MAG: Gfo/Idh/MocA family oxidoreductase [Draconibacterium sp.]|nr:Gfo/Idh/MocA family oxidoreductase [Draconibacterium sp.]
MKKVAVIGFGFMGITHSINILKCKNLELTAIIEKDVDSVSEKLGQKIGNLATGEIDTEAFKKVPVYATLNSCLENEKLDAVHVCVHTDLHFPIVKEALNSGLHVLVEKPFCLDLKEGEELIKLAAEKSLILMVAHVVRFMSPYKKLVEMIDSNEYGNLRFLSLSRFSGVPDWGQWKEKQKNFGISGGALFDLVIHDIDFAAFALQEIPRIIESTVLPGKLSNNDYVNAIWQYPSRNLTVKIEGGNIFPTSYPFQAGYTAVFDNATVSFSTQTVEYIFIDDEKGRTEIDAGDLDEGYFDEIALFSESIENGTLPKKYSPDSALETISLCILHAKN